MQGIRADVAKNMMTIPVIEETQAASDSLGDTTAGQTKNHLGYVYMGKEIVLNYEGKEELSSTQIYLDGAEAEMIQTTSLISCLDLVKQRIISKKIYRGRNGALIIGVLYLP